MRVFVLFSNDEDQTPIENPLRRLSSAFGTKRTWEAHRSMSAVGGKADICKVHGFSTANVFLSVHFSREMSRTAIRVLNQ